MTDTNDAKTTGAPTRRDSRERQRAGSRRGSERSERTRREYVKYGGAVVSGGLLAGCTGTGDEGEREGDGESYSVTMAPAGEITLERPPENVFTNIVHHADMALALGHGDSINALYSPENFGTLYELFLERLEGVSTEWADLPSSWNIDKEQLYELESDLHLADPAYMTIMDSLDRDDIEETGETVAPWFGNTYSDSQREPPAAWADDYEYYTLWEIFEKVAAVFREEKRYQELTAIRTDLLAEIEANLPPETDRPRVARIQTGLSDGDLSISPFALNDPGFEQAHLRPLGAVDAFTDIEAYSQIDLEALVEADPDVILNTHAMGPTRNFVETKDFLETDPVAREIPAVENGRIYPMAIRYGGPIAHLFQLEMGAKELYPEQFGEWPRYDGGAYPEFSESEQLFDRQRIAAIINGEF
ncbi:iron ABC transporter substrate-binding protein [Natrialba aegyptia DSM 13077]|uniref:Iron ABC transporter substrate-binding protein n=1 Tax=Natrialba aegyptia DSM 13077 TaxID=1227491 RepID=M0ALC4_9EURY|nr:ABC transporter substrate-binding protein [Natrialba aegyptia]ELY98732.1 iron ABC transporter substrate-binding protein [Natrialba aegyptia DSM 13077]